MSEVAQTLRSGKLLIRRDHKLLFVCGGPTDKENHRSAFLKFSEKNLPDYRIFLAENSFDDLRADGNNNYIDIAEVEKFICDIADFVLIFPESIGSYAEVGYFSAFAELSAKTLIANHIDFQAAPSFLNRGPIYKINRQSQFGQTVHITLVNGEPNFSAIGTILGDVKPKRSYRINPNEIESAGLKEKFYIAIHLFSIFPILHPVELSIIFKNIFGKSTYGEIRNIVSVLASSGCISRVEDDEFFFIGDNKFTMVQVDGPSLDKIKADILNTYQKHAPNLLELRESAA